MFGHARGRRPQRGKPSMLIVSFSELVNDARVLKQINLFKDEWDVTTCGYGPTPIEGVQHLQIPDGERSMSLDGRLITLRQYRAAYENLAAVKAARRLLKGRKGDFDVVFANEPDTVPIALSLAPKKGLHVDLHEYNPSLHEHLPAWNKRIKPYQEWLIRRFTTKANSWTSPGVGVSKKYQDKFGISPGTVTNAAPPTAFEPTEVGEKIRFVHHGGAQRNRNPQVMIQGFMDSDVKGTFDLYLTGIDPVVREEMRSLAAADDRITIHHGVPYDQLLATLNGYDMGIFVLPPVTFNYEWALPNKLFDFVQARLGQISSPNPEMAQTVEAFDIGLVTHGYEAEDLTRALNALTVEDVRQWKANAHKHARTLSSEPQVAKWKESVDLLAGPNSAD